MRNITHLTHQPDRASFQFRDAWWFRRPLRILTVSVTAFALVALHRALLDTTDPDHNRAIAGVIVIAFFVLLSVWFSASINDGGIDITGAALHVRFESYFYATFPLANVAAVRRIDPKPRWRYRMGLSTDWRERLCASHGGEFVEIEFAQPHVLRIWPRTIAVRRLWLAVTDADSLIAAIEHARPLSTGPRRLAEAA